MTIGETSPDVLDLDSSPDVALDDDDYEDEEDDEDDDDDYKDDYNVAS